MPSSRGYRRTTRSRGAAASATLSSMTDGYAITQEGLDALRAELEQLETVARADDRRAHQDRARVGRPEGERRVPRRQGGPGAPRDAHQAPAASGCAARRSSRRRRRRTASSPSARPSRCATSRAAASRPTRSSAPPRRAPRTAACRSSRRSPQALLGARAGDAVTVETPSGARASTSCASAPSAALAGSSARELRRAGGRRRRARRRRRSGASVRAWSAVSKSRRGRGSPSGTSASGSSPASSCQPRSSVAPFQLAHTVTRSSDRGGARRARGGRAARRARGSGTPGSCRRLGRHHEVEQQPPVAR